MIKLRILLNEMINDWISHAPGSNTSHDNKLYSMPGSPNDNSPNWSEESPEWDGIVEGGKDEWFAYLESNNWDKKISGASVYVTEDTSKPYKFWIKIKTHGLRKKGDTNESYKDRVRKHTKKVTGAWISAAKKIHNNIKLNEVGNVIPTTWKQSFHEALNDFKLKNALAESGEEAITPISYKNKI